MSLITKIADLDDSASLLPALVESVAGFPVPDLYSLFLFEDGSVGSVPAQATDSSGLAHHGALLTGSAIARIAEGVKTADAAGPGFLLNTGLAAATAPVTIVGVARNRTPGGTALAFPTLATLQGFCSGGGLAMTEGIASANFASRGACTVNFDSNSADSGGTAGAETGINVQRKTGANWTGAASARPTIRQAGQPKASWMAYAYCFNPLTGTVTLRAMGSTLTYTDAAGMADLVAAGAGNHLIGFGRFQTASVILGDVGLLGLYNAAKSVAEMDALIAAAKARMALRGVTAL